MAELSFVQYDSATPATIEESIEHAKTNPFNVSNFARKISVTHQGVAYTVVEPLSVIKQFLDGLEEYIVTESLPSDEHYMPEDTALRLYGSRDFWFLIMLLNNVFSCTEYRLPEIRYIPAEQLFRIEKFLVRDGSAPRAVSTGDVLYR